MKETNCRFTVRSFMVKRKSSGSYRKLWRVSDKAKEHLPYTTWDEQLAYEWAEFMEDYCTPLTPEQEAKYDKQVEDIMKELTGKGILPKEPKDFESVYYVPVPESKDYVYDDTDWRKKLLDEEDSQ